MRHVRQEVADLQLQHRHPRTQVAEAVVGAVDVPARGSSARSLLAEGVGGVEVRLALVEQAADVGHHRRIVDQLEEQRIIRQQVEDARAAAMFLARPREVRGAAALKLTAAGDRLLQRHAQPSHMIRTEERFEHQVAVGLEGVALICARNGTHAAPRPDGTRAPAACRGTVRRIGCLLLWAIGFRFSTQKGVYQDCPATTPVLLLSPLSRPPP